METTKKKKRKPLHKRLATIFTLAVFAVVLFGIAYGGWRVWEILYLPNPLAEPEMVRIKIEKGMTLIQVATLLKEKGLIRSTDEFRWAAWILRNEKMVQPGRFHVPRGVSNSEIMQYLLKGGTVTKNVTVPEGLTYKRIAGIFNRQLAVDSVAFVNLCEDRSFVKQMGIDAPNVEGYLYPETYNFYLESEAEEIIRRMVNEFFKSVSDSMTKGLTKNKFKMNLHQAVTLASIIQGEFMIVDEAPRISAVYHNRLQKNMVLAADPCIQYIIPNGPRRLLLSDLKIDNPYNTYKFAGLPPGPINNPGKTALRAAVFPSNHDDLYFVATGDGYHAFNKTALGHEQAKGPLREARREKARQQRKNN